MSFFHVVSALPFFCSVALSFSVTLSFKYNGQAVVHNSVQQRPGEGVRQMVCGRFPCAKIKV